MATLEQPDAPVSTSTLEDELHRLERDEHELEVRTDGIEWRQWIGIAISVFALAVAIFAATIALSRDDNDSSQPASVPAAQPSGGMAGGMDAGSAATARVVSVELGEMYVKPEFDSISAGKVTFTAQNVGKVEHELMIEQTPIKFDSPGKPTEDAAIGMIEDMGPGGEGKMSVTLKPGKYELFCNVPGHYAAGQHTVFNVTSE